MNTIYIVQRIGPYHQARFNQVAKDLAQNNNTFNVIEICHMDAEYQWDEIKEGEQYGRKVLFEKNYAEISFFELKNKLFKSLHNLKPDLVYIPGWSAKEAKLALLWCKINKVKRVLLSDSSEFDFKRTSVKEFFKKCFVGEYQGALVAGGPQKDYLIKLGMPSENIEQGYDVVDNEYFLKNRKSPYQPQGYILAMGRFLKRKNFNLLIKAYNEYRQSVSNPKKLVLCGSGEELSNIESQISNLNLDKYIDLPGFVQYNELPTYYSGASVFIIPSTSEQWGLVINEAMASGLPILSSEKCGAQYDLVNEGGNGFVFDPFNMKAIKDTLIKFDGLNDLEKKRFSEESLQIISRWSTKTFSENLQKLMVQI